MLVAVLIRTELPAQNFSSFINKVPELTLGVEKKLEAESDVLQYPVNMGDAVSILREQEGIHYVVGRYVVGKTTALVYYSKPQGTAPLGKVSVLTLSGSGKMLKKEAIGVFSDFSGMRFHTILMASAQERGAISITSKVQALKENGEVNDYMSKTSIYIVSTKGKINAM